MNHEITGLEKKSAAETDPEHPPKNVPRPTSTAERSVKAESGRGETGAWIFQFPTKKAKSLFVRTLDLDR